MIYSDIKPWHKGTPTYLSCGRGFNSWQSNHITLNLWSHVMQLGSQLMWSKPYPLIKYLWFSYAYSLFPHRHTHNDDPLW